jgi:DNA-binding PadR family transcriptional regulator
MSFIIIFTGDLLMIDSLITSKTRIKLLIRFFLNPNSKSYLRELANEFGESTNSVRVELNRLADAQILKSESEGRRKVYQANDKHPLFSDIQNIVKKTLGLDQLVERLTSQLGDLKQAFLVGDYAKGIDSGIIDLVLVGEVDKEYLDKLVTKTETLIHRKIRTLVLTEDEFENLREKQWKDQSVLLIWSIGQNK